MIPAFLLTVLGSLIILAICWAVASIINRAIKLAARRASVKPEIVYSVTQSIMIVSIVIGISGILAYTGLASQFTVLTIGGIIGIAIAFAVQSTISNVISGIFLMWDRAIRVDDKIQIGNIKGEIIRIGMRTT